MRFFPKTKEEALAAGYTWDDAESPVHPATIKSQDLVDTIKETTNAVLNEIIECASCKRGYKIVRGELNLLRKMRLSLPHECPKCRENNRVTPNKNADGKEERGDAVGVLFFNTFVYSGSKDV